MSAFDLATFSIADFMHKPPGIYYAKTQHNESAIIKVSRTEPIVRVEVVQSDRRIRILDCFQDGSCQESFRDPPKL